MLQNDPRYAAYVSLLREELGARAARRGVDPLDTSKYILAARSALEGGIFDL